MILGDPKRINLSTGLFENLRENNNLYIDKTRFIEHFLNEPNQAQLIQNSPVWNKSNSAPIFNFNFKDLSRNSYKRQIQLKTAAKKGLTQIDEMRYYAEVPKDKPLIKTSIAFCGKQCFVKSSLHGDKK
jgi:hypothetical protein